jgi:hypothetical protein
MARKQAKGRHNGHRNGAKRRGRVFRAFERFVLSIGMSMIAFVVERRLLKALKTGGFKAAPRTAAEHDEYLGEPLPEAPREAALTTSRDQVLDQSGG